MLRWFTTGLWSSKQDFMCIYILNTFSYSDQTAYNIYSCLSFYIYIHPNPWLILIQNFVLNLCWSLFGLYEAGTGVNTFARHCTIEAKRTFRTCASFSRSPRASSKAYLFASEASGAAPGQSGPTRWWTAGLAALLPPEQNEPAGSRRDLHLCLKSSPRSQPPPDVIKNNVL